MELRNAANERINDNWEQQTSYYDARSYESALNTIIPYAEQEVQVGNAVVIVSDFLSLSALSLEPLGLSSVYLQIALPVASAYFHTFYVKEFPKPDLPYRFVV